MKYYAVKTFVDEEIFDNYEEFKVFSDFTEGMVFKTFKTEEAAKDWLSKQPELFRSQRKDCMDEKYDYIFFTVVSKSLEHKKAVMINKIFARTYTEPHENLENISDEPNWAEYEVFERAIDRIMITKGTTKRLKVAVISAERSAMFHLEGIYEINNSNPLKDRILSLSNKINETRNSLDIDYYFINPSKVINSNYQNIFRRYKEAQKDATKKLREIIDNN